MVSSTRVGRETFLSLDALAERALGILEEKPLDQQLLRALLERHPAAAALIGPGIHVFAAKLDGVQGVALKPGRAPVPIRGHCLAHRGDGTVVRFHPAECLRDDWTARDQLEANAWRLIGDLLREAKNIVFRKRDRVVGCEMTGELVDFDEADVYAPEWRAIAAEMSGASPEAWRGAFAARAQLVVVSRRALLEAEGFAPGYVEVRRAG